MNFSTNEIGERRFHFYLEIPEQASLLTSHGVRELNVVLAVLLAAEVASVLEELVLLWLEGDEGVGVWLESDRLQTDGGGVGRSKQWSRR